MPALRKFSAGISFVAMMMSMHSEESALELNLGAWPIRQLFYLSVPKAIHHVVVDHTHRLHKCITDGGSHKVKAPALQVFAHGIGLGCKCGHRLRGTPGVLLRMPAHELPNVRVKTPELILDLEKGLRIPDGGFNFQPVADNAGIAEQFAYFLLAVL